MTESLINHAVFYAKKHLDNSTLLEYAALMMPLHREHCTAYSFFVSAQHNSAEETAIAENVTCDREFAEEIFNRISSGNVFPCHLNDVLYDLIP